MFNFVRVRFPESPKGPELLYSMRYYQQNYRHDFAELQFRDWNVNPNAVKPGTPMEIVLEDKVFPGYVHDIKPKIDNKSNFTKVAFIGASYVMRQSSQAVYKNVTADQVIKQIAKKYGFAYRAEPHPRVYKQVAQAGMTDWEFMVKLAKQSGYFLRAEGTALYFQPLLQDFEELLSETPTFTQMSAGYKTKDLMYNFSAVAGETLTGMGSDKRAISIAGVDPVTETPFKYTKPIRSETTRKNYQPELFDAHATHVVADQYGLAVQEALSADVRSQFPYKGEALVIGSSKLRPGMPVFLDNIGPDYTGYWTILGVEHEVIEEKRNIHRFTTQLTLGTDALGEAAAKYPSKPPKSRYRTIKPNVRNTRVRESSELKKTSIRVRPKQISSLVPRVNRPAPAGRDINAVTWKSKQSDLKSRPQNAQSQRVR